MEFPGGWNRLTASLAVSDLSDLDVTWAFLVREHLVVDTPANRQVFDEGIQRLSAEPPFEGPSRALCASELLTKRGVADINAMTKDPFARRAKRTWRWYRLQRRVLDMFRVGAV